MATIASTPVSVPVLPYDRKVVRETITLATQGWVNVCDRIEKIPVLHKSLCSVDNSTAWLTKPLISRITQIAEISDPWVDRVDDQISSVLKSVNDKVLEPSKKEEGKLSARGVLNEVQSLAQVELTSRYSTLLDYTDDCVEYWLPMEGEEVQEEENDGQDKGKRVGIKLSNRLRSKIDCQWAQVQHLSSDLTCNLGSNLGSNLTNDLTLKLRMKLNANAKSVSQIQIDLVEYAQKVNENSRDWVSSKKVAVQTLVESSREELLQRYNEALKVLVQKAEEAGVVEKMTNALVKAKSISLAEVSEYTLVMLHVRSKDEGFVTVEEKVFGFVQALADAVFLRSVLDRGVDIFSSLSFTS